MALGIVHPITKALYEQDGTGNVRVVHRDEVGVYTPDGRRLDGAHLDVDPHLCSWVAGPKVTHHRIHVEEASW